MFFRLFAAAAMLMVSGVAHAQDWRLTSMEDNKESIFFLDASSIEKTDATARGTIFLVLTEPENGIGAIEADVEFECATGRRRFLALRGYDAQEQPERSFESKGDWEPTEHNTQFSVVWDMMCAKMPLNERSYGAKPPFDAAREIRAARD